MTFTHWVRPTVPGFLALAFSLCALPGALAEQKPQVAEEAAAPDKPRKGNKKRPKTPAPPAAKKRAITAADYGRWEQPGRQQLSANGRWLASEINRVDQNRTLHLFDLKSKKLKPAASFKQGERALFSDDGAWLAVTIGKSPAELKKEKKAGDKAPKPAGNTMSLRRLKDGNTTRLEHVGAFAFSADSRFAAIEIVPKTTASPKPGGSGSNSSPGKVLIIRELTTGNDTTFGNVVRHAWSDSGSLLAMVVDSPSISNALQIFDPARGILRTLESSEQEYATLAWREDAMDLAAMREMEHGDKEDVSHVLLAWRGLDKGTPASFQYAHAKAQSFPEGLFITSGGLSWSRDGKAVYCDLREWEKKPKSLNEAGSNKAGKGKAPDHDKGNPPKKSPENRPPATKGADKSPPPARKDASGTGQAKPLRETIEADSNVEVWHSRDVEIMPQQKKTAERLKNPKRRAVWWLDHGKLVQLGTEPTESVKVLRSGTHALGSDYTPHERTAMFGPRLFDLYLIDTSTGKRERIQEGLKHQLTPSPNGQYLLYVRDGHIWSHEVKTGRKLNLTKSLDTSFTNQEDDTLAKEKRPYASATWLKDSSSVLLCDRFDIWRVAPDGSFAVKLTDGAEDMIRHRLSRASFTDDDKGTIDPSNRLFVALYGERSKKSGYARLRFERNPRKAARLETRLWEECAISGLTKAGDAAVYTFVKERADDSPDLFAVDGDLRKARQITRTNPFQKDFLWGRSELVGFKNKDGVPLQGVLTYPANYKPGQKHPMIVYIYEERSQNLHRYIVPSEKSPYNPAVYSAEGYFVFQPDIVYRPQEPGLSAVDCVVPAVQEVLKSGMIDDKRIGLVGHSWGAYQTAFIVTQTDLFAAGVAGAPLTDMMSMAAGVYWNSGQPNARIFSQSQGRMDKPFWRDVSNYVRNSPIHGLDNLHTPLLMAFGDKDGAVDWGQGVQMYNAARWAGKDDLVMLVYPGENHGLRKEENMVDYHHRILEWFGHYLKGQEARKWITDGTSFLDRQAEIKARKEQGGKPGETAPPPKTKASEAPAAKDAAPSPEKKPGRKKRNSSKKRPRKPAPAAR